MVTHTNMYSNVSNYGRSSINTMCVSCSQLSAELLLCEFKSKSFFHLLPDRFAVSFSSVWTTKQRRFASRQLIWSRVSPWSCWLARRRSWCAIWVSSCTNTWVRSTLRFLAASWEHSSLSLTLSVSSLLLIRKFFLAVIGPTVICCRCCCYRRNWKCFLSWVCLKTP